MAEQLTAAKASDDHSLGLHTVALYEAGKGAVVLLAGLGLLTFMHYDLQEVGNSIVRHLDMDPARKYPQIFLQALGKVTDQNIYWLAGGAALYSTVRFVEAYGLWRDRVWAEWLAIISGGIYIPVEIYELFKHVTKVKLCVTAFNFLLVAYLLYVRFSRVKSDDDPQLAGEVAGAGAAGASTIASPDGNDDAQTPQR